MTFPATRLDVKVELAFGATGSPIGWTWTDVSDRLEPQSIAIRRGRPDESGSLQPASVGLVLNNGDGHLMPQNPASPWFPNVKRGTPLRISVDGAEPALLLGGTGYASTPDNPALDVTDIDIRVRCLPDAWANGITWTNGARTFTNVQYLASRWVTTGNQRSFALSLAGAGWPSVAWSSDGTLASGGSRWFDPLVASHRPLWVGCTVDINNGAGSHVVSLWVSDAEAPPADITTWTLLQQETTTGTTSVFGGSAGLQIGAINGALPFRGRVFSAEIRSTINGAVIANPDFTAQAPGATSFTDGAGRVWTLNGDAAISTRRTRFVGTIDEISPSWPWGDNNANAAAVQPSESRVQITASDLVRRLGQGAKPLRSSLYRHITSSRYAGSVTAYWPCEDGDGAVHLAAGLTTHGTMQLEGKISAAADSTLAASASLPAADANEVVAFRADVPDGPTTKWAVEWLAKVPAMPTDPTFTQLIGLDADGTGRQWRVSINSTILLTEVFNNDGALIKSNTVGTVDFSNEWVLWRLDASETAGTVSFTLANTLLATGAGGAVTDTFTGTLGRVTAIDTSTTAPSKGLAFGHFIVHDGNLAPGWLAGADTAWVGESAAHRIWRLCAEEGIAVEIVGERSGSSTLRGELAYSEAMGPQSRDSLLSLLSAAARTDMGVLTARRGAPGFLYRTRKTLEAQDAARLELDAKQNHITIPLQPRLDDQRLRNDYTVASTGGSSARAVNQGSVDTEGTYEESLTINGVGGLPVQSAIIADIAGLQGAINDQNLQQASWRLTLGTWPGLRYPTVSIDLGVAPDLIEGYHDLEVGDRVTLTGLPAQHPTGTIELLVEAITERLTPSTWDVQLTCSPGAPWQVGTADDLAYSRPTFGWWGVGRAGQIITPSGEQFRSAGMNGGVGLALGQLGQTIVSGRRGLWALDRYPAYRLETGSVHDTPATPWLPGGHINSGEYFDQGANGGAGAFVQIPSRVPWYRGRWNMHLYRLPCWLRSTTGITWEGITPALADLITGYVAETRKLVDEGLVVSPQHHGFTGTDPTLPAALVSNPSLAATNAAVTSHTFTAIESTYLPTGADLSASLQFYDALAAEFAGGDENIWIGLPNEAWASAYSTAYRDWVTVYVRRLRAAGYQGIITFPLPRFAGDLAAYAAGTIDALFDHLNTFGVAFNLVAEMHCYGRDWTGGTSTTYTYAALRSHLQTCRDNGATGWPRPVWVAEVGEATPIGTSATGDDAADRRGVELLLTDIHGPALAGEFPDTCCTGWSFADGTFDSSYATTYGYLNKGNPAGVDPNDSGVPGNTYPGTYPWWDLDPDVPADREWLTRFGEGMLRVADRIRPRRPARLEADTTATLASTVTTSATSLPLTAAGWATNINDYPMVVEVNGEQMRVGGVTGTTTQTLTPVERALNTAAKTHAAGSRVAVVDKLRATLGHSIRAAGTTTTIVAPPSNAGFRRQLSLATAGQPPHILTKLGYSSTLPITRAQLDGILDAWCTAHGGTIRTVTSTATWATAAAAAVPGDLIRVTTSFTGEVSARGNLYGLAGASLTNSLAGGTETLPIIVTCADGVEVSGTSLTNNVPVLDLVNCRHVWAVGFNVGGTTQFGIRAMDWGGTAAAPAYIAYCNVEGVRDASIAVQGWFQAIALSGGTPPAGSGNEHGYSEWAVVESNTMLDPNPGDVAGNPGEGIYCGKGASPGWVGFARDVWVRGNHVQLFKANGYEAKPGCRRIYFTDNVAYLGRGQNGAPFELCYQFSGLDTRPAWMNDIDGSGSGDIQIYVEGNRVYDYNITETGTSRNQAFLLGMAGVRIANNLLWSWRNAAGLSGTGDDFYAVLVQTEKTATDFGDATVIPTWVVNNNFQSRLLTNLSGISGIITRNNITPTGYSGGSHNATSADYVATTPAVGSLGTAENGTAGPGSAFELKSTSALLNAGTSIADLGLYINADLFQRPIPSSSPNPGPYQHA